MSYTYSIDLSKSWTTSDVVPLAIDISSLVTHVKNPILWYNPQENKAHMWGGLPFNSTQLPGFYTFTPSDSGGVIWIESASPDNDAGVLQGLWGTAYASSPTALYSIGGVNTVEGDRVPVQCMVTNTSENGIWTNQTNVNGFGSRLNFDSRMEYVPNFGDEGVLVALSGRLFQNQSSYTEGDITLAGFSSVDIYDISKQKWYSQRPTRDVPVQVSDFCTVGLESDDGGSYEV